ncbi:MAG: tetratricopeptide repeat protein, partial [Pirellulales bacterium]
MQSWVHVRALSGLLALMATPNLVLADRPESTLRTAVDHYAQQQWDEAADAFRLFLTIAPNDSRGARSRFYLAESLMQLGRFVEAKKEFQTVLREASNHRYAQRSLFRCGEIDFLMGAYDEALGLFQEFDASYPDDPLRPHALVYLGRLHLRRGKLAQARQAYEEAFAKAPSGPASDQCRLGLAMVWEREGDIEQALSEYRQLAEADAPAIAEQAYFRHGIALGLLNRHADAVDLWQDFPRRYPDSSLQARVDLACAESLLQLDRHAEARKLLEHLPDDAPFDTEAAYWLGRIEEATGKWRRAADRFSQAADQAPKDHPRLAALRYYAGANLLKAGHADEALTQFELGRQPADDRSNDRRAERRQATDQRPGQQNGWSDDLLVGVMRASLALGRWDDVEQAVHEFHNALPDSNLAAEVELIHAALLIARRQPDAAIERLEASPRADDLGDLAPFWQAELAIAYAESGQYDQARRVAATLFDNGVRRPPDLSKAIGQLAEVAFSGGQFSWAAELFEHLASGRQATETSVGSADNQQVADALAGLAWCQICLDEPAPARETLKRLASLTRGDGADQQARWQEHLMRYGGQLERLEMESKASDGYRLIAAQFGNTHVGRTSLLREADQLARQGRYEEARERYVRIEQMTTQGPREIELLDRIAGTWQAEGAVDQAALYWKRIRSGGDRTSSHWIEATYLLAKHAREMGRTERATKLALEIAAIVDSPDDVPPTTVASALFFSGRLAADRSDWDEVAVYMKRLIDQFPRNPYRLRAEFWVAESRFRQGDIRAAVAQLHSMLPRVRRKADAWFGMVLLRYAQLLAHTQQWNEALEIASGIADAHPGFSQRAEVDYLIGRCHTAQGRFAEARTWYEKATHSPREASNETAAMAQWMIGETYMHQQQYAQARREYLRTEIVYDGYPQWQARALL